MNITIQGFGNSIFGGGPLGGYRGLKSTQQKLERQAERDSQVDFYEKQKENLKNVKCETVEEIAKKLEMFHSYEDQIAAAKAAYNSEQMMHIMDESREMGEKIAEAAEKLEPKTPEERREELVEEALGIDENGGVLEEVLDEVAKLQEELQDTLSETTQEGLQQTAQEELQETIQEDVQEQTADSTVQQKIVFYEEGLRKEENDPIKLT